MNKYFPAIARHAKAQEFLELRQGTMTVMEYMARFTALTLLVMSMWPQIWPRSGDLRMD